MTFRRILHPSPNRSRPGAGPARLAFAAALALASAAAGPPARSDEGAPADKRLPASAVAGGSDQPVISATRFEQLAEGELVMEGDVELRYGELRLLADTVHFNDATRMARAEGNVVLMFGKSQISGDRLEMNVDTRLATIWNAHGYMDPDVIFQAEKLERIADDKVVITDGTVTTCTQPTPYWSFHVSRATLHLDHYAHMRNVAFKASKVPVLYTPYLIWPMKQERASGLLLPNVGYSKQRGSFIGNALYLVLGRSQDATLFYDRYGKTGTGLGFEYRAVPAPRGEIMFTGYHLRDTVADSTQPLSEEEERTRYRFKYLQSQKFRNGFSLLADLNKVSDLDYYLDFERDITQTTSPTVFSHIDIVRNWKNYALNVRFDRQEQFITSATDLTLQRLPELELRARGIRFGRSPFYLSFETSAGVFNRDRRFLDPNGPQDPSDPNARFFRSEVTYERFDLFPTISASFTPTPWLDISPSISARETWYSRSLLDPNSAIGTTTDESVSREFASFNLSVVGPRFFRIFGDPRQSEAASYKHTFEPRVTYSYIPDVSSGEEIIRFDEVDTLPAARNAVTWSLTSRLFAKRPPRREEAVPRPGEEEAYATDITGRTQVQAPGVDIEDLPGEMKEALKDAARNPTVGAVEVATFDLSQAWSFDEEAPLSTARPVELDGTIDPVESRAGPLVATVRYNPSASASVDLRTAYDTLLDDLRSISMSANLRSLKTGYLRLSWFLNRDLEGRFVDPDGFATDPNNPLGERRFFDASQVRIIGGTAFLKRRITLDLEGSYDIEGRDLRDQRYRLGYNTQCCGVLVEVARRDFETIDEIEYRFVLNLRGVGTFLDLQGRPR